MQAQARAEAARQRAESLIDPETGRPFFQPAITRAAQRSARHEGQSVGDYLYSVRHARMSLSSVVCHVLWGFSLSKPHVVS